MGYRKAQVFLFSMQINIPPQEKQAQEYLILHLDDTKKHDQYEASLYMKPFLNLPPSYILPPCHPSTLHHFI